MKQKPLGIAIRRFTTVITEQLDDRIAVAAAVGTLIQTLAKAAHDQATQVMEKVIDRIQRQDKRIDALETKLRLQQRHIEQIDLILDERARAREVGG